jgi:hypothetical protein
MMPKTVVGIIAATLVAAGLLVSGVAQASTPTLAQQVQQGRDRVAAAWQAKDVDAVRAAVAGLAPALAQVRSDVDRQAMSPAIAMYLGRAEQQRTQLAAALGPQPRSGILDSVTGLVSGLLDSLSGLLSGLLGGGHDDSGAGSGGSGGSAPADHDPAPAVA